MSSTRSYKFIPISACTQYKLDISSSTQHTCCFHKHLIVTDIYVVFQSRPELLDHKGDVKSLSSQVIKYWCFVNAQADNHLHVLQSPGCLLTFNLPKPFTSWWDAQSSWLLPKWLPEPSPWPLYDPDGSVYPLRLVLMHKLGYYVCMRRNSQWTKVVNKTLTSLFEG